MASALIKMQSFGVNVKSKENQNCRTMQMHVPSMTSVDVEFTDIKLEISQGLRTKSKYLIPKQLLFFYEWKKNNDNCVTSFCEDH